MKLNKKLKAARWSETIKFIYLVKDGQGWLMITINYCIKCLYFYEGELWKGYTESDRY